MRRKNFYSSSAWCDDRTMDSCPASHYSDHESTVLRDAASSEFLVICVARVFPLQCCSAAVCPAYLITTDDCSLNTSFISSTEKYQRKIFQISSLQNTAAFIDDQRQDVCLFAATTCLVLICEFYDEKIFGPLPNFCVVYCVIFL